MPRLSSSGKVMLSVKNVVVEECTNSAYVRPFRLSYTQGEKKREWDMMKTYDSVAILLHHIERNSLLFVRQFRPPVYYNRVMKTASAHVPAVGTAVHGDPSLGLTVELCAGIVDKSKSLAEIAAEEIQEEVGFRVAASQLERVTEFRFFCRNSVGETASLFTLYYAQVTESMRISAGGGNSHEGEYIETLELPISQAEAFIYDDNHAKPPGCAFAVMWFLYEKYKPSFTEKIQKDYPEILMVATGMSLAALVSGYVLMKYVRS